MKGLIVVNKSLLLKRIVRVFRWFLVALAAFLPVIREAIGGTADILQLITSTTGGRVSLVLVVFISVSFLALQLFFPSGRVSAENSATQIEGRARTIRWKEQKQRESFYQRIISGLVAIMIILSVGGTLLIHQSFVGLDFNRVIAEFSEQTELKEQSTGQQIYLPVAPPTGATIHAWEMFPNGKYTVGEVPNTVTIDRAEGHLVEDPLVPNNLVLQVVSNQLRPLVRIGSFRAYSYVAQARIRVLVSSDVEIADSEYREYHDTLVDGQWHTVAIVIDGTTKQHWLDGKQVHESQELTPSSDNDLALIALPYSSVLYDDILVWIKT
jgi:hypothetical protein